MCEKYRVELMALLDGELNGPDLEDMEQHLHVCPHCNREYNRFQKLNHLACQLHFSPPRDVVWDHYWKGVCRKLETRANWIIWGAGSLFLVCAGTLMTFGFGNSPMALALGAIATMSGICLLWLSYFCNCKS